MGKTTSRARSWKGAKAPGTTAAEAYRTQALLLQPRLPAAVPWDGRAPGGLCPQRWGGGFLSASCRHPESQLFHTKDSSWPFLGYRLMRIWWSYEISPLNNDHSMPYYTEGKNPHIHTTFDIVDPWALGAHGPQVRMLFVLPGIKLSLQEVPRIPHICFQF